MASAGSQVILHAAASALAALQISDPTPPSEEETPLLSPQPLVPTTAEMLMTDASGRDYEIRGEVIAANRIAVWPNMDTWVCLARWECEGQVCYGDLQQVQWHDYVRQFLGR